jgi:protein kinase C substrate 80K-H
LADADKRAVAHFYESKDTFACIGNPSITLKPSQLNDNSCDCPDGSDEPGTAACAFLDQLSPEQPLPASLSGTTNTSTALPGFWCENEGHIGAYIPFMYVNDGVCDYDLCCDGSEEYAGVGGVKCPNRCAEIGKEHRKIEEDRKKGKERAAKRRRALAKDAKDLREKVEARVTSLKDEIAALVVKRDDLQRKFEEVERSEKGKIVGAEGDGGKLGVLLGLSKKRVSELRETLEKVKDQRDDLQEKVDELEGILKKFKEEYNPNFNDEGVKQAVHAWEDYAASLEKEVKVELEETDLAEVLKADSDTSGINWADYETEDPRDTDIRKLRAAVVCPWPNSGYLC